MKRLSLAIRSYLYAAIVGQLPVVQQEGNINDAAGMQAYLSALSRGAMPVSGGINVSTVTNASTTPLTLTPANCANGILNAWLVASGGSANTNTTDTATAIINGYWPNVYVGATSALMIFNLNSGNMTLAGGTGVTITGTATMVTTALGYWVVKCTNLANPTQPGAVATNTTTTTSATANNAGINNPTSVINVASATGINANASWLQVTNTDGSTSNYFVTAVNTLAITVAGNVNKNIASGAAVSVFNNTISITRAAVVTAVAA